MLDTYDVDIVGLNRKADPNGLRSYLDDYDYICPTITDHFAADILGTAPIRTRALCNFGAGVNHIDLEACRSAGVMVTNTPDVLTDDTADIAIMLMLMAARRAGEAERLMRAGDWVGWSPTDMLGTSLTGKTIGLIGLGRIGQRTARKAQAAFGMRIVYTSRTRKEVRDFEPAPEYLPLEELLAVSDIVSLHAPGGTETRHIIDEKALGRMKTSAILINTARGDLVDEEALSNALQSGAIAAAGLDVFAEEPKVNPRLRDLENAVLLPHIGSATQETRTAMGMRAMRNLQAIIAGDEPPDRVA